MISSNVLHRVIHIGLGDHAATGTIIHVDGREYLVTARHFAELVDRKLEVAHNGRWQPFDIRLIGHSNVADVTVLAFPNAFISEKLTVKLSMEGMIYSEEVYFLGFPFGLSCEGGDVTGGYPIPFVKRAIVANFSDPELGVDFWLDGHNNIGFSGGPVVCTRGGDPNNCIIRGFICGYHTHPEKIKGTTDDERSTYYANSGLIIAASINRALDLIAANPTGPLVKQD